MSNNCQMSQADRFHNSHREEGITFFGKNPGDVLSAFHISGLAEQGFSITGRIIRQHAALVIEAGEKMDLLNGEILYAGTFTRQVFEA